MGGLCVLNLIMQVTIFFSDKQCFFLILAERLKFVIHHKLVVNHAVRCITGCDTLHKNI